MQPLRLIQISDCHLSADPNAIYRDQSSQAGFETILSATRHWNPDLILLTGDLSQDASTHAYQRIAEAVNTLNVPVISLPGNHDDPQIQSQFFPTAWEQPLVHQQQGWCLILLNSAIYDQPQGQLSEPMLDNLKDALEAHAHLPCLVVLHHQPVAVGTPWIDRHPVLEPQKFLDIIDQAPQVKAVLWGHIHQSFRRRRNHYWLMGSPSTAANNLPGGEVYRVDPAGPACRWLKLHGNGQLNSGILRDI